MAGDEHGDDDHGGGHNLFELGTDLDLSKTLICLIVLIAFTILFEVIVEHIEHQVSHRKDLKKAVEKIFRELSILGVISFSLFMIEQLSSDAVPLEWLLSFEFAHIMLFFMALVYVGQCVHASIGVIRARQSWLRMHNSLVPPTRGVKRATVGWFNTFGKVHGECEFCLLRTLFISRHKLPQDFEFAEYVFSTLVKNLTEIMEISKTTWGLILGVVVLLEMIALILRETASQHNLRSGGGEEGAALSAIIGVTVGGWLITLVAWALLRHLQSVIHKLLDRSFWYPMQRMESVRWSARQALRRALTQEDFVDGVDDAPEARVQRPTGGKHVHFADEESSNSVQVELSSSSKKAPTGEHDCCSGCSDHGSTSPPSQQKRIEVFKPVEHAKPAAMPASQLSGAPACCGDHEIKAETAKLTPAVKSAEAAKPVVPEPKPDHVEACCVDCTTEIKEGDAEFVQKQTSAATNGHMASSNEPTAPQRDGGKTPATTSPAPAEAARRTDGDSGVIEVTRRPSLTRVSSTRSMGSSSATGDAAVIAANRTDSFNRAISQRSAMSSSSATAGDSNVIDVNRRESFNKALTEAECMVKPAAPHEDLQLQMYRVLSHKAKSGATAGAHGEKAPKATAAEHNNKEAPKPEAVAKPVVPIAKDDPTPAPAPHTPHPNHEHQDRCKYCGASREELRKKRPVRALPSMESDIAHSDTSAFKDLTVDRAFIFNSPKFLRRIIDFIFVATCFHVALVFVFQLYVSLEVIGTYVGILLFLANLLAPIITVFLLNPALFQKYTIVMAIAHVQPEILGDVLESMMQKTKAFRSEVIVRLRHELQLRGRQGLQQLFQEMDRDGDGIISIEDLRDALAMMGVFYSGNQFRSLLAIVNPEGKGVVIDYHDFVELIFPSRSHWSVDVKVQQPLQEFEMSLAASEAFRAAETHHAAHITCLEHLAVLQELSDEHPSEMSAQAEELEMMRLRIMEIFHQVTHDPEPIES